MAKTVDRLDAYNAKRDFDSTPEPEGKVTQKRRKALRFLVQKHDARRLHYDFRLEWDGVLLSWAVTRGPSDDPGEKRLAVRTEDHPLSYADFEGTIPKGEYGGGTVMLWDQGTWTPETDPASGLTEGKLKLVLHGSRMRGGWALVRMRGTEKRENWLLIKERDDHATNDPDRLTEGELTSISTGRSMAEIAAGEKPVRRSPTKTTRKPALSKTLRKTKRPAFRSVQLATLFAEAPEGNDWLHETKFDGYRALAALGEGGTRFYTRSGNDWTDRFGMLEPAFEKLACNAALIDGEVMAAQIEGSAFSALQAALSDGKPLVFYAFDLLSVDSQDITGISQIERRERLAALIADADPEGALRMSEHIVGNGPEVFRRACAAGAEGIISKRIDAPYRGKRTVAWRKIKCSRRQEFVIGGFSPSDKASRPFSSLLMGGYEEGKLRYRGRVGTGFSEATLVKLAKAMTTTAKMPFNAVPPQIAKDAVWVRPELVAEVAFPEFTAEGHIRHGSFLGLRDDKQAGAVSIEMPKGGSMETKILGVMITHPDRAVFPDDGCTKLDVARHYERVGDRIVALAGHRPLSLYRCPDGISQSCFFQKHDNGGMPDALSQIEIAESDGKSATYLYATRAESFVAAAQMGTLEFHIWGARTDRLDRPDRLVFDLDPDAAVSWSQVRAAAFEVRDVLTGLGLESGAMVTGGKGIHVWMPLRRNWEWERVKLFAKTFAHILSEKAPDRYLATMSKAKRKGRIFIDWLRNERGATAVAPYSVRARKGAPVAVPVTWDRLKSLQGASAFQMGDMPVILKKPCPALTLLKTPQILTDAVVSRMQEWADDQQR